MHGGLPVMDNTNFVHAGGLSLCTVGSVKADVERSACAWHQRLWQDSSRESCDAEGTHIELPCAAWHSLPLLIHTDCVLAEVTLRCGSRQTIVRHRVRWDW